MTNARERINKLLADMGIDIYGVYTYAEIFGYCAGIELVKNKIDNIVKYIFINLQDNDDLSYYKAFVKSANTKESIMKRLGESYGYYGTQDLIDSFFELHESFVDITADGVIFDDVDPAYYPVLGAIATGRIPEFVKTRYAGNGKSFDEWDLWGRSWIELDNMGLPFDIIDTLRGEQNE